MALKWRVVIYNLFWNYNLSYFIQALPHILLWRGEKQMTVGKLMVELWKADEKGLGVKRDQYGVISGMY